jgi:mannose-1-phosphate guanylyltransferase
MKNIKKDHFIFIIAGGHGERLWPKSRIKNPKYLFKIPIKIKNKKNKKTIKKVSLLNETIKKSKLIVSDKNIFIITNKNHNIKKIEKICKDNNISKKNIITEPVNRNTALAITLSLLVLKQRGFTNSIISIFPADHLISNTKKFLKCIKNSKDIADIVPCIIILGIKVYFPSKDYGYIKKGKLKKNLNFKKDVSFFKIEKFIEKPNLKLAKKLLMKKNYFWNSGIFTFSFSTLKNTLKKNSYEHYKFFKDLSSFNSNDNQYKSFFNKKYFKMKSISFDYAIMEKSENVLMIEAKFQWKDIGNWESISKILTTSDKNNNLKKGKYILLKDSKKNIVINEESKIKKDNHLVVLFKTSNLMVIRNKNVTLVCPKNHIKNINKIIDKIKRIKDFSYFL